MFDSSQLVAAIMLVVVGTYALTRKQDTPAQAAEVARLFIFGLTLLTVGAALNNALFGVSFCGTLMFDGMAYCAMAGYLFLVVGLQQLVRLKSRGNRAE